MNQVNHESEIASLVGVVEDLIGVVHQQAEEMQRLATHVEQQTNRLTYTTQVPVILSELHELRHRLRQVSARRSPVS